MTKGTAAAYVLAKGRVEAGLVLSKKSVLITNSNKDEYLIVTLGILEEFLQLSLLFSDIPDQFCVSPRLSEVFQLCPHIDSLLKEVSTMDLDGLSEFLVSV